MLTASILGILTGLVLGLTGAGGGILAVPALVVGLEFDMTTAAPVALIAVGLAALVGAIDGLHKREVRYKAAVFMAIIGALCSSAGVQLAHAIPEHLLATVFAAVMVLVAVRMAQRARCPDTCTTRDNNKPCRINPQTGRLRWTPRCTGTLAAIGAVTGMFAGMLGVGGGFIIVPAFRRFTDISQRGIVATSLMLIALVSLSAATGSLLHGVTVPTLGWVFVMAAVTGMVAGRRLAPRISEKGLLRGFSVLTLVAAAILLTKAWTSVLG